MQSLVVLVALVLVGVAHGHICIIYPRQVGPMNISLPGSHDCYRRTAYCGGFTDGPITVFPSGQAVDVTMQQNLNHFNPPKPGYLILLFSPTTTPKSGDWVVLDRWDDYAANDMIHQVNFTRRVVFPDVECNPCLLGAQYVSYNQYEVDPPTNTDAIFYNCANIALQQQNVIGDVVAEQYELFEEKEEKEEKEREERDLNVNLGKPQEKDDVMSCCAPDVFEGEGVGYDFTGEYTLRVLYDATLKRTRFDRKGFYEPGRDLIDSTVITFYDSGPPYLEYVIDNTQQSCTIYGADEFYPWCFGEDRNMDSSEIIDFEEEKLIVWKNPTNQFTFTAHHELCLPRTVHHESTSYSFNRYRLDFNATHFFDLPPICSGAKFEDPCGKKL